ncbi:GNAT family N-acetyltransferase [Microseira wollei]|nr:N-acetyltransferase [Microseira wollei]
MPQSGASMISILSETAEDIAAIREVVTAAFGRPNEAALVEIIRNSPNFIPELSLVAKEDGKVLGHILFSLVAIETQKGNVEAIALAPLCVTPTHQRQSIGAQLVQAGITKCRELDHNIIILVGHPHYYPRFGFQKASQFGIQAPFTVPDSAFMVLELKPDALTGISGIVRYPEYFNEV